MHILLFISNGLVYSSHIDFHISVCAGVSLLWVAVLGGIVLYIYAVISFAFLHESVNDEGENALFCDTLGQCFISVVRWGLIDNLGLVGLSLYILLYSYSVTSCMSINNAY